MIESQPERKTAWTVTALTVLALLLRLVALGYKPFWQDEVFSVLFVRSTATQFWSVLRTAEMNMALYYLTLREWTKLFHTEAGVRLLSVIPGVLTIPVVYAIGTRLYSRRVGIWAAALFTVNTCAVVYSQEARGYSMLVLFTALSSWAFLRLVAKPGVANCALYTLVSICGFYCHFYSVFVLLAHAVSLVVLPDAKSLWKPLAISWTTFLVAAVPGYRAILWSHGSNLWWLPRPGFLEIYRTLTFLAAEGGKGIGAVLAVLLLVAIAFGMRSSQQEASPRRFEAAFAPILLATPLVATLLLSLWRPLFFHRFLIICLVPFLLVAAAGLDTLRKTRAGVFLATLIFLLSIMTTAISYRRVREDWRGAAAYTAVIGPQAPVVFYIKDAAAPFAYYRERQETALLAAQIIRAEHQPSVGDAAAWSKLYPQLWLVRFPAGPKDDVEPAITGDMLSAYKLCDRRVLKGISVSWFCSLGEQKRQEFRISPGQASSNHPSPKP